MSSSRIVSDEARPSDYYYYYYRGGSGRNDKEERDARALMCFWEAELQPVECIKMGRWRGSGRALRYRRRRDRWKKRKRPRSHGFWCLGAPSCLFLSGVRWGTRGIPSLYFFSSLLFSFYHHRRRRRTPYTRHEDGTPALSGYNMMYVYKRDDALATLLSLRPCTPLIGSKGRKIFTIWHIFIFIFFFSYIYPRHCRHTIHTLLFASQVLRVQLLFTIRS